MNHFIMTKDKDTAELLNRSGFEMITNNYGAFYFLNCLALTFDKQIDKKKITYTDILPM